MSEAPKTVPLYRVENPNIPSANFGLSSHEDLVGQWFTPSAHTAIGYLRKSSQTFGRNPALVDGAQLVIAHVPQDQLDSLNVSRHPIAATMDVEADNFIVPRDGSVVTDIIPLDETVGDLRGQLGRSEDYLKARERILAMLGEIAVDK